MWPRIRLTVMVTSLLAISGIGIMAIVMPPLPVVKLAASGASEWEIPAVYQADPKMKVEQLSSRTLWKEPAAELRLTEDKPLTPPDWRIVAVVKTGGSNQLVISFKDNPANLQTLSVGDKLPGGFPVMRIEQNWVVISVNGKKAMLAVGRN
ncbi:hypothetical protein [Undibacterium griseum]|uniref:Uncharacterized protein n=1 Tax=Undibacterium griseum TaxID=2762295 RepID=A0ABR6YPT4_9BURK|nr:hypothetical protein [Undibacterium griseum]MBC3885793.1 hypothetical protein [Undibacterium griseum]